VGAGMTQKIESPDAGFFVLGKAPGTANAVQREKTGQLQGKGLCETGCSLPSA
jgi:hypothetical protein